MTTTNYHVLIVKTLPATNTLPARVNIKSERFEQNVTMSFNNEMASASPTIETAVLYLNGRGFEIIGTGEGKYHYYIISSTFEPIK